MGRGRLHELLAVEADLRSKKDRERDGAISIFGNQSSVFLGAIKNLKMFDDNRSGEEQEVRVGVADTVMERMDKVTDSFIGYFDLRLQKEQANQMATADVIINGKSIFTDVPVTFLLNMEEELRQLRRVYAAMPTLKPGVEWVKDEIKGRGIYKAKHPVETSKTEKTIQHKVIVQPTANFPAQYEKWSEDRPIGKYITENWSGMISDSDKAVLLSRLDTMLTAFKQARQRANCTETDSMQIGKEIFAYINGTQ
jgi:hypothetical protein